MHRIYQGSIYHTRLQPVEHSFSYPAFFFGFDLDQLTSTRLLGYNRHGLLSLRDRDYLDDASESLAQKCRRFMGMEVQRIHMLTVPRVFGYVFNPVTFYIGYDRDDHVVAALAEVNNTFKERHVYALREPEEDNQGNTCFSSEKAFHVSPFNDRLGRYRFRMKQTGENVAVHVDIEREGRIVFKSGLIGSSSRPLTDRSIIATALRFPLQNLLTLPRIHGQAARLYFKKKLPYYPKPAPNSVMTIKIAPPTALEKLGMRVFFKLLARINYGQLHLTLPDGKTSIYGSSNDGPVVEATITDYTFFRRILLDGDIGLGESYMYGQWTTPDLTTFMRFIITNRDALANGEMWTARLKWLLNRILHLRRANTKAQSPKNIGAHYDLSNDFFSLFLDPTMMYSSAVFASPEDTLEQAQHNRMRMLIEKLDLKPEHHVLEIGSGWGGFAIEMAQLTGCRVTSITVSQEQLTLARERVAAAGLQDQVSIEFCDYRDVQGSFDRIVSIEMLEAVGHAFFSDYFGAIERVLKPDGQVVLQVIIIPDDRYDAYRNSVDWIQKHIFPGGLLPSVAALKTAMDRVSNLHIIDTEDIALHYATTLRRWSENLAAQRDRLLTMGYDDIFYRTWQYYFSYCEAAFATRTLKDLVMVLRRA